MSGRRDPSRTCTKPLPYGEVAHLVNHISSCRVSDSGWAFGKPPYSRGNQPPVVSSSTFSFLSVTFGCCSRLTLMSYSDLPRPAGAGFWPVRPPLEPDRSQSDTSDPDLGAAAMEEEEVTGGGG